MFVINDVVIYIMREKNNLKLKNVKKKLIRDFQNSNDKIEERK